MICKICNTEKPETNFELFKNKYRRKICKKCRNNVKELNSAKNLNGRYIRHLLKRDNIPCTPELIMIKKQLIILLRSINYLKVQK